MKRKLAILFIAAVSCVCCAAGLAACEDSVTITITPNSDQTVTASGHVLTHYDAVAATCTTAGNSEYYYCTDCGKYFSDSAATTEIGLSDTVIAALGHDYEADFTWTKTSDGYAATATQYCSRCNTEGETVEAAVELTSQTSATCTEDGEVVYTATAKFNSGDETDTKTLTDPATGHTYSEDWESDDDYHWHVAICEHTDEISEKTAHTYEKQSNGNYVCSVCGHEMDGSSAGGGSSSADDIELKVGANYITLGATTYTEDGTEDSSSFITGVTYTAPASGVYTFSIPTDCKALIYIYDSYNTLYRLGYSGNTNTTYSVDFELAKDDTLNLSYISHADNVTFDSDYTFCLTISYVYKDVVKTGTAENPYAFTNPNYNSSGDYNGEDYISATIAAGGSYYFTVTRSASTLTKISFSNNDSTAFELYVNGAKVDYGTYYYLSGTTTATFYIKNISSETLTNTITCDVYFPALSTSANELEIESRLLDSSKTITYYFTVSGSTSYTITLGSDTDSNVAVYYLGEKTADSITGSESTLILGAGAGSNSYIITNNGSRDQSYLLAFTYTESTVPESFKVYLNFTEYDPDDYATYTTIAINTATEAAIDTTTDNIKVYYSYDASAVGTYTLTLSYKMSTSDSYTWSNVYQSYTTVKINGTVIEGTENGVYTITLNEGVNHIVITCNSNPGTLSTTLADS